MRHPTRFLSLLLAYGLFSATPALAVPTEGVGDPLWAAYPITLTTNTSTCAQEQGGFVNFRRCALFKASTAARDLVTVTKGGPAIICAHTDAIIVDIVNNQIVGAGTGDHSGVAGTGSCVGLATAADRHDWYPYWDAIKTGSGDASPGARIGLCPVAVSSGKEMLHAPCASTTDCVNYGAGSCTLAPTAAQKAQAGVFFWIERENSSSDTVIVTIWKETIRR